MVGDGDTADAMTQDFATYWESNASLAGGVLVYNTGRSLGGFISLLQEKKGALALPDVLITAVGTKACLLPLLPCPQTQASLLSAHAPPPVACQFQMLHDSVQACKCACLCRSSCSIMDTKAGGQP